MHFINRWKIRDIEIEKAEETIKTGSVIRSRGRKVIIERYFGKENETYCLVCIVRNKFIEVKTAWKRQGR
ncbi:hypothetical protein COV19_00350 [Candidatus Woesearchaeota archaeon CG10_big_fil_rev_8_21_14_0_10_44_13]|nr:MAG: hypothetical protein COV19_00350 [Candidatus Woesearchaeota archaeon CG10_big_fil_rev_8_21_14_0_10_44_13]